VDAPLYAFQHASKLGEGRRPRRFKLHVFAFRFANEDAIKRDDMEVKFRFNLEPKRCTNVMAPPSHAPPSARPQATSTSEQTFDEVHDPVLLDTAFPRKGVP
jgi:hypothetical protein